VDKPWTAREQAWTARGQAADKLGLVSTAAVRAAVFLPRKGPALAREGEPGKPNGRSDDEKYDRTL